MAFAANFTSLENDTVAFIMDAGHSMTNRSTIPDSHIVERVSTFYYGNHYQVYHALTLTISITGIITNILNILVLNRKEMKNSTNLLLTALAVSDILVVVTRVPKALIYYYYTSTNDFVSAFSFMFQYIVGFQYATAILSNWISVAIGIWRFIAVTWPLRANELCSMRRANHVIFLISSLSLACSIPYFILLTTEEGVYNGKAIHTITPIPYFGTAYGTFQFVYKACIFLILSTPVFILIGITAGLIRNMCTASKIRKKLSASKTDTEQQTNRTTLMLTVVLIIFIVNNLPVIFTNVGYAFPQFSTRILFIKHTNIFKFFFMLDNTSTFFTYFAMSRKFRRAFFRMFDWRCCAVKGKVNLERIRNLSTETTNTIAGSTSEGIAAPETNVTLHV